GFVQTTANPPDVPTQSGQSVSGITFGVFDEVTLSGTVFNDVTGNGKNDNDPGLDMQVVQLDRNGDGTVDASATTDAAGHYSFTNVGPGSYQIRLVTPAGYVDTTPQRAVVTASGQDQGGQDFGVFRTITISGRIFTDQAGDGTFSAGDTGLASRQVLLDQA